jgi:hypothetical protein
MSEFARKELVAASAAAECLNMWPHTLLSHIENGGLRAFKQRKVHQVRYFVDPVDLRLFAKKHGIALNEQKFAQVKRRQIDVPVAVGE